MLNFKNISPKTDFYSKLDILNKNLLYTTHMCDKILKICNKLENSLALQKQVDDYMETHDDEHEQGEGEGDAKF